MDVPIDLSQYNDLISTLTSAFGALGIFVTGAWAYFLFAKHRKKYPRAIVTLSSWSRQIDFDHRFLHITICIRNSGEVLIGVDCIQLIVYKLYPINDDTLGQQLVQNKDEQRTNFDWEIVGKRETYWNKNEVIEIEPGEEEIVQYDLILPGTIAVVQIYSYVRNNKKKRRGLGWNRTEIVAFDDTLKMISTENGKS